MYYTSCEPSLQASDVERFSRQIICEGIGASSMARLLNAHVVLIGLGGLGSTAALYLTAAGIGHLTFIDGDRVEVSNLHRQVIHTTRGAYEMERGMFNMANDHQSITTATSFTVLSSSASTIISPTPQSHHHEGAMLKVESARLRCMALRPDVTITAISCYVTVDNVEALLSCSCDVVVDCSDNMGVRYLINDAAMRLHLPVVSGSAMRWEGQLTVYGLRATPGTPPTQESEVNMESNEKNMSSAHHNLSSHSSNAASSRQVSCPCYRCLYPVPPPTIALGSCSDCGVLGPIPGMIGCLQALEVIKIITHTGSPLAGRLFIFDGFNFTSRVITLRARQENCVACSSAAEKTAHLPLRSFVHERPEYLQYCNNMCGVSSCKTQTTSQPHVLLHNNNNNNDNNHNEYTNEQSKSGNLKNWNSNGDDVLTDKEKSNSELNSNKNIANSDNASDIITNIPIKKNVLKVENDKLENDKVTVTTNDVNEDISHISVTEFAERMNKSSKVESSIISNNNNKNNCINHDNCIASRDEHNTEEQKANDTLSILELPTSTEEKTKDSCNNDVVSLCVDVRTPVQFDMAHLHNSISLPLETIEKWNRQTSTTNLLEHKWVEFIHCAVKHAWLAQQQEEKYDLHYASDSVSTCNNCTERVQNFESYWHNIRKCNVFVICRRGIASLKAVHLLKKIIDALSTRQATCATNNLNSASSITSTIQLPFKIQLYNVDGGLNSYSKVVDNSFPFY